MRTRMLCAGAAFAFASIGPPAAADNAMNGSRQDTYIKNGVNGIAGPTGLVNIYNGFDSGGAGGQRDLTRQAATMGFGHMNETYGLDNAMGVTLDDGSAGIGSSGGGGYATHSSVGAKNLTDHIAAAAINAQGQITMSQSDRATPAPA